MKLRKLLSSLAGLSCASAADNIELSRQATDPTASLMALNFQTTWVGGYHGAAVPGEPDEAWSFQFRPVIPFQALGHPNILRATIPYQLGGLPTRFAINPQYNLKNGRGLQEWSATFTFTALFPTF